MDYDDFYSQANLTLWRTARDYDPSVGCTFEQYLANCLHQQFKTVMTKRNRAKRIPPNMTTSLQQHISRESDGEFGDLVGGIDGGIEKETSEVFERFVSGLTSKQREMVDLMLAGFKPDEIAERMNITRKKYDDLFADLSKMDRKLNLFPLRGKKKVEVEVMELDTKTMEKSKSERFLAASLVEKINELRILFNHPAQRESEQWSSKTKGNLISDIIQGNPIPPIILAEQIIDGTSIVWDIDGKQRCTTIKDYMEDAFKISRNIRRYEISYQVYRKDENGEVILNDRGVPMMEWTKFDIRNKKYSQLPDELQKAIRDYVVDATLYLNCSDDDIIYHIERYNDGRAMNCSQKGVAHLGVDFARKTKAVSGSEFFKDHGDYKMSEFRNGTIERVVVESIMATNYIDSWKKSQEDMCVYIKDNAVDEDFDALEENIDNISKVITDDVEHMFTSRDSFIWFALYAKFISYGVKDDSQFIDFLREFNESLHSQKVNGISYDDYNDKTKGTKDKYVVQGKLMVLENLMFEFLDEHENAA